MTTRITHRPFLPLPDNPVCLYSHPHLYLSTGSTHLLDAARRQALLSALESEYSSAQSEVMNAPMCAITSVSSVATTTLHWFVHVEDALALASILNGSCSTSSFHGLLQNIPGTWNARRHIRQSPSKIAAELVSGMCLIHLDAA